MQNTIWNATAGSIYQMRQLDIIANNLANADTPGYKGDQLSFQYYLSQIAEKDFAQYREGALDINRMMTVQTSFSDGRVRQTGNQLDFAINGEGFFSVQTDRGEMLTRAGAFQFDSQGQLVTADGELLVGDGGPIQLLAGEEQEIQVDEYGYVYQAGEEIGRIKVTAVENPETLTKQGGARFSTTDQTRTEVLDLPELRQGFLEGSNINVIRSVTEIVQAGRAFEAYQNVIRMTNSINEQANRVIPATS